MPVNASLLNTVSASIVPENGLGDDSFMWHAGEGAKLYVSSDLTEWFCIPE